MPEFRAPVGTRDVLPPESARWTALVARFAERVGRAGYGLVVSPTFEDIGVFERVGESTEIVRKEMYDFRDKGDRHLALRPEGTASVVRAFVQHRPTSPFKAWYVAPSFRYERPQAGRYRQHHQVGVEAIGSADPDLDVEVIGLAWGLLDDLGLRQVRLLVNSLGDPACRPAYLGALRAYLHERQAVLSEDARATLAVNPLRVLDSKRPDDQLVIEAAPRMVDHLCDACAQHFTRLRAGLDALGLPVEIAPRLVRGLDYYVRTTFELAADALDAAQNAVGGGGRYDGLVEELGGPPTPGMGFGMGIERLLLACDAEGVFGAPAAAVDVWVIDVTGRSEALVLADELRSAGVASDRSFDGRSMRSQMKAADRSGARVAVIVGDEELAAGVVAVRDLRNGTDQELVPRAGLVERVKELLS
ncbi:MAG: histidine--tRNA ligase [Acidimicrobiales bacterium]|nr:histidine--tRNA ligase [Acidimicrobiales bacterium]